MPSPANAGSSRTIRALLKSQATATALLETAAQAILAVDEGGRIMLVNAKAEEMFGYGREELLGQSVEMLLPDAFRQAHERHRAEYFSHPRSRPMGIGMDLAGRRKDGSSFPAEVSLSHVQEKSGPLAIAFITDITRRKQAEEELRRAKETLEGVVQASPLAIWAADLEGRVTLWNAAAERIFGWKAGEVLGRPLPIIPADRPGDLPALLDRTRRGAGGAGAEHTSVKKDGSRIEVSVWTSLLTAADGAGRGVLAVVADATERRQLESQLRQSQKMEAIGRLAGGVAHDFNNLLTVITGYSDLVLASLKPDDSLRKDVQEIRKAGERASRLTNQLLAFSRRQVIQPRTLDLNGVIRDMHQMLRRTIGEICELHLILDSDPAWVRADAGQVEQVVVNLVLNARDAMPRGGRISIETARVELGDQYARTHLGVQPGPYVMLAVSDQGAGMDEQTRSRLFEPFFTTKEKGTGLGLSTVYGIVKQNGGEIWVYSEPGFGSTFKIYLPRVSATGDRDDPDQTIETATAPTETILLVEDEPGVRKLVREMLARRGYTVLAPENSADALAIGKKHRGPIHLLLTDVVMPNLGGRELARRLGQSRPAMKVLYMSGYTDAAVVHNGVIEPGAAFLQKPFTAELLERKIREVLDADAHTA